MLSVELQQGLAVLVADIDRRAARARFVQRIEDGPIGSHGKNNFCGDSLAQYGLAAPLVPQRDTVVGKLLKFGA